MNRNESIETKTFSSSIVALTWLIAVRIMVSTSALSIFTLYSSTPASSKLHAVGQPNIGTKMHHVLSVEIC